MNDEQVATEEAQNSKAQGALLNLDEERVVSFRDRGHLYKYVFSRITQKDWEEYFAGIVISMHNEGNARVSLIDGDTGAVELVEKKLVRVEGYRGEFEKRANWKQLLPLRHTRPAADLLRCVSPASGNSEAFDPERFEAVIDAVWGVDEKGEAVLFKNLTHTFGPLTAEQKRRYCRATSESRVVGGSRNGRTIFLPKQSVLLKLYDELIIGVDGYAVGGRKIESSDEARREVDAYHKVIAAQQLFIGSNDAADAAVEADAA